MDGDFRQLPLAFFDLVADMCNRIEQGLPWPQICCAAVISTIPKASSPLGAEQLQNGQIMSGDGLATRPITNLSPLYGAYASVRFS